MGQTLLFLDFHYGDLIGGQTDWMHDIIFALITAVLSGVVVSWGINYEKRKEHKKKVEEHRFLLFDIYIICRQAIAGTYAVVNDYIAFRELISKGRLDSNSAHKPIVKVPEIQRILNFSIQDTFQAFISTFENKTLATINHNLLYSYIESLNHQLENMQAVYDEKMDIRYNEMGNFISIYIEMQRQLSHLGASLKQDVSEILGTAIKTEDSNLYIYLETFIYPAEKFVKKFEPTIPQVQQFIDEIKKAKLSLREIEFKTKELEDFIKRNVPEVIKVADLVKTLLPEISKELAPFIKDIVQMDKSPLEFTRKNR